MKFPGRAPARRLRRRRRAAADDRFDDVGYGLIPHFRGWPPQYEPTTGRMFSTSKLLGLTKSYLKLLTNADAG
jgi:hypothetical protein